MIYRYPKGQKLTYSSASTNSFLPYFNAGRRNGRNHHGHRWQVEITVGPWHPPIAEVPRTPKAAAETSKAGEKKKAFVAGATMVASGGPATPIPIMTADLDFKGDESFINKEVKFAKRWLTSKGVILQEEQRNPVDTELESFFQNCRDGKKPKADLEVGLADSIAVMLSNQAMDEGRKVYFNEIDKSKPVAPAAKKG